MPLRLTRSATPTVPLACSSRPKSGALCRCCAVRWRTAERRSIRLQCVDDPRWSHAENHMLLIVGAVILLIAVVIIFRMWRRGRMDARNHGWMSERWLAEQRASDSH